MYVQMYTYAQELTTVHERMYEYRSNALFRRHMLDDSFPREASWTSGSMARLGHWKVCSDLQSAGFIFPAVGLLGLQPEFQLGC